MLECTGTRFKTITYKSVRGDSSYMPRGQKHYGSMQIHRGAEVKSVYTNGCVPDLFLTNRDRSVIRLPGRRDGNRADNTFTITVEYQLQMDTIRYMSEHHYKFIDTPDEVDRQYKNCLEEIMRKYHDKRSDDFADFSINYTYDYSTIVHAGGVVYIPEHDLLVETAGQHGKHVHPNDRVKSNSKGLYGGSVNASMDALVFAVRIIDNERHRVVGDRYINFGGTVYHIGVERDRGLESGVHLTIKYPANHEREGSVNHTVMSIEAADYALGLCRDIETALESGSWTERAKRKHEEISHDMKMAELTRKRDIMTIEHSHKLLQYGLSKEEMRLKRLDQELKVRATLLSYEQSVRPSFVREFKDIATTVVAALGAIKAIAILMR